MHLHDFKGAKEDAESCTALKPSWAKGWARLGAAQGRLGEITEAVASYEKAHELDPTCDEYQREAAKLAAPRRATAASITYGGDGEPFGALTRRIYWRVACLAGVVVYATSFTTDASTTSQVQERPLGRPQLLQPLRAACRSSAPTTRGALHGPPRPAALRGFDPARRLGSCLGDPVADAALGAARAVVISCGAT